MKRMLALVLIMIMAVTGLSVCAAPEEVNISLQIGNSNMTVNGIEKPIDENGTVPILTEEGRTLLPVRAVMEEMGGTVAWDETTQTATLTYGEDEIRLTIDSTTAYLNGEARTLDVAPALRNDRTMLPIRFIAESFQFDVDWDDATQTAAITKTAEAAPQKPEVTVPTEPEPAAPAEEADGKILVAYFSATNNTEGIAEKLAEGLSADIYEILPQEPYTDADLNYNTDCRANREQNDPSARPAISGSVEHMEQYDTVFVGYPIWWGNAPKIIFTFLESYDFDGKTIIPFCTSGSSPIGSTTAMETVTKGASWLPGHRFSGGASADTVMDWVNSLDLD